MRLVERGKLAAAIESELRQACRAEAAGRRALGTVARELLRRRVYRRLGFARLGDYAGERLGISARALEIAARVATRLDELPAIAAAFRDGELTWTQVRVLCNVAGPADEASWLDRARGGTVDDLEALIAAWRAAGAAAERDAGAAAGSGIDVDPDPTDDLIDGEPAVTLRIGCPARVRLLWRRTLELAERVAGARLAAWQAAEIIAAEGIAARPAGVPIGDRVLLAGIRLARRLRRVAASARNARAVHGADGEDGAGDVGVGGNAGRVGAGRDGAGGDADHVAAGDDRVGGDAGCVAAGEDGAGDVAAPDRWREAIASDTPVRDAAAGDGVDGLRSPALAAVVAAVSSNGMLAAGALPEVGGFPAFDRSAPLADCDAFALDAHLLAASVAVRCVEPRIGRLLRLLADHRLYRLLGHASLERYVRARLGLGQRKAWALLKIERGACRAPGFAEAYAAGRLSWLQALTLLSVVDRQTEAAWLERAEAVTLRRLRDEVNWVLERRDALGPDQPLAPPPLDASLSPDAWGLPETAPSPGLQIGAPSPAQPQVTRNVTGVAGTCATRAPEVRDSEVRFTGPVSVVALFRDALDAYDRPGEPRSAALERLLARVSADWLAEPRHRDPVFARDGWRCTVPGCSGRRNLHDHHLQFRSRGGGNERANRVTVCAAHHLQGVHTGAIRAWGRAPRALHWELGVRAGRAPFLAYVGDRLIGGSAGRAASGPAAAGTMTGASGKRSGTRAVDGPEVPSGAEARCAT